MASLLKTSGLCFVVGENAKTMLGMLGIKNKMGYYCKPQMYILNIVWNSP